jgi:hypothetical protein
MPYLVIIAIIAVLIGLAIYSHHLAKKRQEAMLRCAQALGLEFYPSNDHSFDERYPFIAKLCQGNNRYAFNILSGVYRGSHVQVFDYHYETQSRDSKGRTTTHHHYFSFFILLLDYRLPELLISREGWVSKFVQFLGFDDIDFESAEFSQKFLVKSPNKKFAYDICHSQMIEYLLANSDLNIEIEHNCYTLFFGSQLEPELIQKNLDRLIVLRDLIPEYVEAQWKS